jgi:hypothetical protein
MFLECPVCKCDIEVIVRFHTDEPFVDGRTYSEMCFTCASVPKTWEYDAVADEVIVFDFKSPNRLCTVEDMVSDGWDKEEAQRSIKAVKKLLKNPRFVVASVFGVNVFEHLFVGEELLYELDGTFA